MRLPRGDDRRHDARHAPHLGWVGDRVGVRIRVGVRARVRVKVRVRVRMRVRVRVGRTCCGAKLFAAKRSTTWLGFGSGSVSGRIRHTWLGLG